MTEKNKSMRIGVAWVNVMRRVERGWQCEDRKTAEREINYVMDDMIKRSERKNII